MLNKIGQSGKINVALDHGFLAQSMCLSMLWGTASPQP